MKVKVAICISSLRSGGAEHLVVELIKAINQDLYEIHLFILEKRYQTSLELEVDKLQIPITYLNKKSGFSISTILKLTYRLRMFKPDIIHGHLGGVTYSLLYTLFTRVKIIQTVHTLAQYEYSFFKRLILKFNYHIKKIVPIGVSQEISHSIENVYKLSKPVITIYNGINLANYAYNIPRSKINVIGHIGRFEDVKNHLTIYQTFKKLLEQYPYLRLLLIGSGSNFQNLLDIINNDNLWDKVWMPGHLDDVYKYYQQIDLFLMPSLYEGMPLAVIEAMACGCVVVASNVGGIKDLINQEINGYLIDNPLDVDSFFNKIENLINSPHKIKSMSTQNIIDAKKYGIKETANEYQRLYLKLSSRKVKA